MMATEAQLIEALRRADEAGNTADAQQIANEIRKIRVEGQQFPKTTTQRVQRVESTPAFRSLIDEGNADPLNGTSIAERIAIGAGQSVAQSGRGIGQLLGIVPQSDIDEAARLDARILNDPAGRAGQFAGLVGQVAAPGGLLKGGAGLLNAGRAANTTRAIGSGLLAPRTVGGAAAVGGIEGGLLIPTTSDEGSGLETRLRNTALGTGGGVLGVGVPRAIGALARNFLPPVRTAAQELRAANAILGSSRDPAAVRQAVQGAGGSIVQGSRPTLAELTGDTGLAGLQRTLRATPEFAQELALRQEGNNAARVQAIRSAFGGADDVSREALKDARDRAANAAVKTFIGADGVNTGKVTKLANSIIANNEGRPAVQDTVQRVANMLDGVTDVKTLFNVRKSIGDILSGQAGGDAPVAKAASRELLLLRSSLDNEIRKVSPEFGKFLKTFKAGSREIDQVKVGEKLLTLGGAVPDINGNPVITPASFLRGTADQDQLVKAATGFRKARASSTLTPEQQGTIDAVRKDVTRANLANTRGKDIGSDTVQKLLGAQKLSSGGVPIIGGVLTGEPITAAGLFALNQINKRFGRRIASIVQEAALNPERAAQILQRLPSDQRVAILQTSGALFDRGAQAATLSSVSPVGVP